MSKEPLVLCIDPSQRYLGYAYRTVYNKFVRIGAIEQQTQNAVDWHLRACLMAEEVRVMMEMNYELDGMRQVIVLMEVPDNWHTERGQESKNSEAVQKLYFTAGTIIGQVRSLPFVQSIYTVLPRQWKGATPKSVMMERYDKLAALHQLDTSSKDLPDDAAEAALLAHLSYAKQLLEDDVSVAYFSAPYVNVYLAGDPTRGQFSTQVYHERDHVELHSDTDTDSSVSTGGDSVSEDTEDTLPCDPTEESGSGQD